MSKLFRNLLAYVTTNNVLPSQYERLDYIERAFASTNIDTGILADLDTEMELDFMGIEMNTNYINCCGRYENDKHLFIRFVKENILNSASFVINKSTNKNYYTVVRDNSLKKILTRYKYRISKDGSFINDDLIGTFNGLSEFTSTKNITFGTVNGSSDTNKLRIYGFKIRKKGELMLDYLPCYRKSDGICGVYDTISKKFYSSSHVLEFIGGNNLPEEYTEIESVKSNLGNTAYIDTGLIADETTEIYCDFNTLYGGNEYPTFDILGTDNNNNNSLYVNFGHSGINGNSRYGTFRVSTNHLYNYPSIIRLSPTKFIPFYGKTTIRNLTNSNNVSFETDNLHLFKINHREVNQLQQIEIFRFIMKKNGEYVANYTPCRRNSDGEIGFWDSVSERFLKAEGNEHFYSGITDKEIRYYTSWVDELNFSTEYNGVQPISNQYPYANGYVYKEGIMKFSNEVTSIGDNAFRNNHYLETIILPKEVTTIGQAAFMYCSNLDKPILSRKLTTIGSYAFYNCSELKEIFLPLTLTTIGSYAFYNCLLKSITIPTNVTSIGESAFELCRWLEEITLPSGITTINMNTFKDCAALKSIILPSGVTNIGDNAFYRCNLTSVTIPEDIQYLGEYAFAGNALTEINIPSNITKINDGVFSGCTSLTSVTISDNVTEIGDFSFGGCSVLTSITIPSGVTSIGDNCFSGCTNLRYIYYDGIANGETWGAPNAIVVRNVPHNQIWYKTETGTIKQVGYYYEGEMPISNVYENGIGKMTFANDVTDITELFDQEEAEDYDINLTHVILPNSVENIGDYAFFGCDKLEQLIIPDSVTKIGEYAFSVCERLNELTIPDNVEEIGKYCFDGCRTITSLTIPNNITVLNEGLFFGCINLVSVNISDATTNFGAHLFDGCISLTNMSIPKTVTSIGLSAFYNCSGLTEIVIPYGVTSIYINTFRNCTSLSSIIIPETVTLIHNAFFGCTSLKEVIISDRITSIPQACFSGCSNLSIINYYGTATGTTFGAPNAVVTRDIPSNQIWYKTNNNTIISEFGDYYEGEMPISNVYENGIGKMTFANDVTISESMFEEVDKLTNIYLPNSIDTLGEYAFADAKNLKEINIPSSVKTIDYYCFTQNWSKGIINRVVIPKNLEIIKSWSFFGCRYLTEIAIPNNVNTIGNSCFGACDNLATIHYSGSATGAPWGAPNASVIA